MPVFTHRSRIAAHGLSLALMLTVACSEDGAPSVDRPQEEGAGGALRDGGVGIDGATRDGGREAGPRVDCPADGPQPVNRVRIYPAPGKAAELAGVRIQGSNTSPTNDFVDLTTIEEAPRDGAFTEIAFDNGALYRYVKLYAPEEGTGSIAELELYHDQQRISGEPFGTAANSEGAGGYALALDDDPSTVFDGSAEGGSYVGLDVAGDAIAEAPTFTPPAGNFDEAPMVELVSAAPDVRIRYTLDGSNPTRDSGEIYEDPITPKSRTNIKAVAYADCLFESPVASARYGIGPDGAVTRGLKSYHLGNSLTDTINPWLKPIADSTGVDHQYARWTIPGAAISWLNDHRGQGFGEPEGANYIDSFAASYAPIDHISLQPFSDPSLNKEGAAAVKLLEPVIASSPEVQVWLYAQWPQRDMPGQTDQWKLSSLANGASWADPPWKVERLPTNWEEATISMESFSEAFRGWLDEKIPGKEVHVVPGGRGLVNLKRAIEKGEVPGIGNFYEEHFSDDLHLSEKGQYMISLVFYACLYQQSPDGATFAGTGLNEAQAKVYQRIAWETASDYRWSGLASP